MDYKKVTMESVKNFAWNQMDAMWYDGSGLATVDMVKFEFNGYWVVSGRLIHFRGAPTPFV